MPISHEHMRMLKHWGLTIAFFAGFVLDVLMLDRVDSVFGMSVLGAHIIHAALQLSLLFAATAQKVPEFIGAYITRFSPLLIQFSFGALISGSLIFYGQSGSWSVSWPFLLILLSVMVGNELVKDRTQRIILNLSIFYLGVFSYAVLFIPILLGRMGALTFVGSGIASFIAMMLYVRIIRSIVPHFIELHLRSIVFSLGMIFVTLNTLYFLNIIPPIPLSLKHIDIYHRVEKVGSTYRLTYEEAPWYKFWREADTTYRRTKGEAVYCFASVFAPTKFSLSVVHVWDYYNPETKKWSERARIPYTIEGGSDRGYRGYSMLRSAEDGVWRCSVETSRGQVLGRETFRIVSESPKKPLVTTEE